MFQGKYALLGIIGSGTYGNVYKACLGKELAAPPYFDASSRPYYAIKRMKGSPQKQLPTVSEVATLREVKLLKELHHPNVVPMIEVVVNAKNAELAIVFEYAELDVEKMIRHQHSIAQPFPDFTLKSIVYQSLKGLEYLHENWVMHRDLKPANILVIGEGPHKGRVMLADLGMARIFRTPVASLGSIDKVVVTLWFRAPELLLGVMDYTTAIDVWSMGCIFADLLLARDSNRSLFPAREARAEAGSNDAPFQMDQCDLIFRMLGLPRHEASKEYPEMPRIQKWYVDRGYPAKSVLAQHFSARTSAGEAAIDLLSRMLDLDPEQRVTASGALAHEFFKKGASDNCLNEFEYPVVPPRPLDVEHERLQHEEIVQRAKRVRESLESTG